MFTHTSVSSVSNEEKAIKICYVNICFLTVIKALKKKKVA